MPIGSRCQPRHPQRTVGTQLTSASNGPETAQSRRRRRREKLGTPTTRGLWACAGGVCGSDLQIGIYVHACTA
eukprot:12190124-Alexandrium_andersonii.AAC.1